jgi:hypothetical protein
MNKTALNENSVEQIIAEIKTDILKAIDNKASIKDIIVSKIDMKSNKVKISFKSTEKSNEI